MRGSHAPAFGIPAQSPLEPQPHVCDDSKQAWPCAFDAQSADVAHCTHWPPAQAGTLPPQTPQLWVVLQLSNTGPHWIPLHASPFGAQHTPEPLHSLAPWHAVPAARFV